MAGRMTKAFARTLKPVPASNQNNQHNGSAQNQGITVQENKMASDYKIPQKAQPAQEPEPKENDAMNVDEGGKKLPWMKKGNLNKVKRASNSVRRGRQNRRLRKLLTPKNAVMVLNELHGSNPIPEYKMDQNAEAFTSGNQYKTEVVVNGSTYQGQGMSKMLAKISAAEKAIRDLVLEKMKNEKSDESMEGEDAAEENGADAKSAIEESNIPMIHLASYALHKLFSEWQAEGYEIPLFTKNSNPADSKVEGAQPEKKTPKGKVELPVNATELHPVMLLGQMRPGKEFNDISVEGTVPGKMVFTVGVTIDGQQFSGSAKNKKEARRQAAMQACATLFGIEYSDDKSN